MSANLSNWMVEDTFSTIENNLSNEHSSWINSEEANSTISKRTMTSQNPKATAASTFSARAYSASSYDNSYSNYGYDDSSVCGYYNTGGGSYSQYYDEYGYSQDTYIESSGYDAYGASYSEYSCYSDYYYDYGNYSKTMVYFYWTKNNDGVTNMTGSETGAMSPWAMAVQMNKLIGLVNTHASKSIGTVSAGTAMTYSKYNEVANAIGAATVTQGTKITVQHFYKLQTTFNSKGYYVSK